MRRLLIVLVFCFVLVFGFAEVKVNAIVHPLHNADLLKIETDEFKRSVLLEGYKIIQVKYVRVDKEIYSIVIYVMPEIDDM